MVVLVSTSEPGLTIFPTHRIAHGPRRTALRRGDAHARRAAADARRRALPRRRLRAARGRRARRRRGRRVARPEGVRYTARRGGRRRRRGEAEAAFLLRPTPIETSSSARRGETMPQKRTYFYPKLASGLLFHPLDRLARACRAAVDDVRGVLPSCPTRASVSPSSATGMGGDETTAIDEAAERVVIARFEDARRHHDRLRGGRPSRRRGRPYVVVDPIDGSLNAKRGIPFFCPLDRGRRRADDGRRPLRLRPRLRLGRGVDRAPRRRRVAQRRSARPAAPEGRDRDPRRSRRRARRRSRRRPPPWSSLAYRLRIMGSLALVALPSRRRAASTASVRSSRRARSTSPRPAARPRGGLAIDLFDAPPFDDAPLDLEPRSRVVAAATTSCAPTGRSMR